MAGLELRPAVSSDGNGDGDDYNEDSENQPLVIELPTESVFTKRSLPEDTYSFLIYSPMCCCSRTFCMAICVFLFQTAIYAVLAYDITTVFDKQNPLNLPAKVTGMAVRIAQFFAIVVALVTQNDLHRVFGLLRDGFHEDLPKAFPGAKKWKRNMSILLRLMVGLLGLSVTFLLIMQSTTVIDVLLNFLAMEFVSLLDDVVFALMREGFFGKKMQKEAKILSNTFYHVHDDAVCACCTYCCCCSVSCLTFMLLFAIMIAAWAIIGVYQKSGDYLCGSIYLQFGDDESLMLGTLSGRFKKTYWTGGLDGGTIYSRSFDPHDSSLVLAYCDEEERWTVSLQEGSSWFSDHDHDPCDWIAASDKSQDATEDFNPLTTQNSQWFVRTSTEGDLSLSQTPTMRCNDVSYNDCYSDEKFCGDYGTCYSIYDYGSEYRCLCDRDHYGFRCQNSACSTLEINLGDEGFLKGGGGGEYFASKYYLLELEDVESCFWYDTPTVYDRRIYTSISFRDSQTLEDDFDIIFFTGVRWILTSKSLLPFLGESDCWLNGFFSNDFSEEFIKFFESNFHEQTTKFEKGYLSEPVYVDIDTRDQKDTGSPSGLQWIDSAKSEDGFIGSSFACV